VAAVIVRWRGDRALGDREAVAHVYQVSQRTVRRYCEPCDYDAGTRRALYDVLGCEDALEGVLPRPESTAQARALRSRREQAARFLSGGR
jgi:hypothetical protein